MPYQWIPPELFVEHQGVAVYHCYDDGDERAWYWYTTDPTDCNLDSPITDEAQFDVRDLPALGFDPEYPEHHGVIIRQAIEAGLLSGNSATTPTPPQVLVTIEGGLVTIRKKPAGLKVEIVDYDALQVHLDEE